MEEQRLSVERTCGYCGETKDWKKFALKEHINGRARKHECLDCYRERVIHKRSTYSPKENLFGRDARPKGTPESRWEEALAEIERLTDG